MRVLLISHSAENFSHPRGPSYFTVAAPSYCLVFSANPSRSRHKQSARETCCHSPAQEVNDTVFDVFVVAHVGGWVAKTFLLRNQLLLWATSVGFEVLERSLKHLLPNFNECWWDSWVLDVAVCNLVGK